MVDDIFDSDLNIDNPNMEGATQGAGQQGPQRMVIPDHHEKLNKVFWQENGISRQSS